MIQYSNINDAWGNKDLLKKNSLNNLNNKSIENNLEVQSPNVPNKEIIYDKPMDKPIDKPMENIKPIEQNSLFNQLAPTKEHFFQTTTPIKTHPTGSCSFAEHLKTCEECRNSLTEYLDSDNTTSTINLFGLKITISKDVLKIIFIISIVCIFILLLSMVNISFKDDINTNMKYLMKYNMIPQQIPYFRPY